MSTNKNKSLPVQCPACGQDLHVIRLACEDCSTIVEGRFTLPLLARLTSDEQLFLINLVKCSGSLKDMARLYSVSYPTVRNRLDTLISRVKDLEKNISRLEIFPLEEKNDHVE